MPRPLDEILGLKKTAAVHNFEVGQAVRLLATQRQFRPGRTGTITKLDEWRRLVIILDKDRYPAVAVVLHHSHVEPV